MSDITITLTISIPDGATVSVQPKAGVVAPASSLGNPNVCPIHNMPWKHVPGGVSKKTGNPYKPFWSCPDMDCKQRPPAGWKPPAAPPADDFNTDDLDWEPQGA